MLFMSQCLSSDRVQLKERPLVYSLYLFQFGFAKKVIMSMQITQFLKQTSTEQRE